MFALNHGRVHSSTAHYPVAQIQTYIQIKTLISGLVGLAVWGILHHLGVDCAPILGLLTGFANYIPSVGPFCSTLLPLPLVLLNPDMQMSDKVLAMLLPFLLHTFVGNFVEIKIMVCEAQPQTCDPSLALSNPH